MSEFKELGRLLSNVLISNGIETKAQLVEIMSNNPADIIKLPGVGKMSLAKISNWISGDPIKSMQAEIERLKTELEKTNKEWLSLDVMPHGTTLNSIKAQGIEDALSAVGCPYGDDTIGLHNWLEEYADNLRTKEGE